LNRQLRLRVFNFAAELARIELIGLNVLNRQNSQAQECGVPPRYVRTLRGKALLTPKQAEDVQVEFKRLAHEAGIKGARINVQRVVADDYEKVISEAKACLRTAMPKAA